MRLGCLNSLAFLLLVFTVCHVNAQRLEGKRFWVIFNGTMEFKERTSNHPTPPPIPEEPVFSLVAGRSLTPEQPEPAATAVKPSTMSPEMMYGQHPIDYTPPKIKSKKGSGCRFNGECETGCCLLNRANHRRTCQPLAAVGEKCSTGQIKVSHYSDYCPCSLGDGHCEHPNNVCSSSA